jgi:hypothetical protein
MNKRELENMRFILSLGQEQFGLWYMKRDEDEKEYIDELLIRYTVQLARVDAQLDAAILLMEDKNENQDLTQAKQQIAKIMSL